MSGRLRLSARTSDPLVDVAASAAVVTAALTACCSIALTPQTVTDGVSWFGVTRATLAPYAVGLLTAAGLLLRAAWALPAGEPLRPLSVTLRASAVLMVGVLVTPYTVNTFFNWTHMTIGAALFLVQLAFAVWFWRLHPTLGTSLLLAVQLGAGLVALASLPSLVDLLLYGQIVYQVVFAVLLVRAVRTLVPVT